MEKKSPVIPADILETIFLKLRVKALVRFKSVSTYWKTIISDPRFVHAHLHKSRRSYPQNLFIHKYSTVASLVEFKGGKLETLKNYGEPYKCDRVLCSSNGMVLLGDDSYLNRALVLWNPSARTVMKFRFGYNFHDHWCVMCYGIWHDRGSDDVKVIFTDSHFYAVFSCKTKTWTKKKSYAYSGELIKEPGVCAHGVVYWTTIVEGAFKVTYYDPVLDDFFLLDGPKGLEESKSAYVVDLGGYLCLSCNWRDEKTVRIWKMDDTCWKWEELVTIENVPTLSDGFKPLCFVEDKIVVRLEGNKLVVYSPSTKTYQTLLEDTTGVFGIRFAPYVESLLCPTQNMTRPKRKRTSVDYSSYICHDDADDDGTMMN